VAGHVRRLGGTRSPKMGKEAAVWVIRAKLVGASGRGGARERGELDGTVALAGDGSTAAAASGGAERQR
jgi:hypothetical protein